MNVLIVDDSVVYRSAIKMSLKDLPEIDLVDSAANGKIAIEKVKNEQFDIITLDIEMPIMDGIETIIEIRKINKEIPIIVFSAQNDQAAEKSLRALHNGASDIVKKIEGSGDLSENIKMIQSELLPRFSALVKKNGHKNSSASMASRISKDYLNKGQFDFIGIGSSTGGPDTLKRLLSSLPKLDAPILIVQHMPAVFTTQLAKSLDTISKYNVVEAKHGMTVEKNHIYIAPGDYHMQVHNHSGRYQIVLNQNEKVCFVRPAVDVLFKSMAESFKGKKVVTFVLTGMGNDGADGSFFIKEAGGSVIAQDEKSCVVWGMPKAVIDSGNFDDILSIEEIIELIPKIAK